VSDGGEHFDSGYSYASCENCSWKASGEYQDEPSKPAEMAKQHAVSEGHRVTITETTRRTYDYRVERS
jgi:hypothetical protein